MTAPDPDLSRERTRLDPPETAAARAADAPATLAARTVAQGETSASAQKQPSALAVPDVQVEELIARGGMSELYRGVQKFLNRVVAVKVLPLGDHWNADLAERFQREARLLAELNHPHIVSCHQAGSLPDGRGYLVMEYVDGPNLSDYVKANGPLPETAALEWTRDVAIALAHAMERGIVHRDVKPQNVLLKPVSSQAGARRGSLPFLAKLADLGIARYAASSPTANPDSKLTQMGQFVGTPSFMAPEQFDDATGVDQRADIYGLGGILYFVLCGKIPFSTRSMSELIRRKAANEFTPLRMNAPAVRPETEAFVARMLEADPHKRIASYQEVIATCEALLQSSAEPHTPPAQPHAAGATLAPAAAATRGSATPVPAPGNAPPRPAATRSPGMLVGILLAVVVFGAIGIGVALRGRGTPPESGTPASGAASPGTSPAPLPAPPVRHSLAFAGPPSALFTGDFSRRLEGWKTEGIVAADEETDDGIVANAAAAGGSPAWASRALAGAPWRMAGTIDLSQAIEAWIELRGQSGEPLARVRLQNLGSSLLAGIETEGKPSPPQTLAGEKLDAGTVAFRVSFDGVDIVAEVADTKLPARQVAKAPASIALVATKGLVGFRQVTEEKAATPAR